MQRYLVCLFLAIVFILVGCDTLNSGPTPEQFRKYDARAVLDALTGAGLSVQEARRDMIVAPDAPAVFTERYVFVVERIAPAGGQVLIFSTADDLKSWQGYFERLRSNSVTRRDVANVYVKNNALLQLSPDLTLAEANAFRDALMGMS